jgi:hemerythrin-like domain-containing protein
VPSRSWAGNPRWRLQGHLTKVKDVLSMGAKIGPEPTVRDLPMSDTISRYLARDHRRCDQLLAACEAAVDSGAWETAEDSAARFRDATLHHFALEEDLLFPAVEQANPAASGPTGVMRVEHRQIRQLLNDLAADVRAHDRDSCLGDLETLHMLSQQHNVKEESVLYPMAEMSLAGAAGDLVARMEKV